MGFFTEEPGAKEGKNVRVAIPFRVGWGFSRSCKLGRSGNGVVESQSLSGWDGVFHYCETCFNEVFAQCGRNPFQGGMGFFTLKIAD